MPLQATSGTASYDAFGGGVAAVPNYIEDVFSTYLYTGNGSTQTITNGIDLSGEGGLVWWKNRTNATGHGLIDTTRGIDYYLSSNTTDAQDGPVSYISSVSSTGYSIGAGTQFVNQSANNYVSWTFRKQAKFFDVVTTTSQTVSHSLASVAGFVIWKRTDASEDWNVLARKSDGSYVQLNLNLTDGAFASYANASAAGITSTNITLPSFTTGGTYVVYLYAHNAGGFGLTGTDNVISCGSYTGNGSTSGPVINLGYEPQWILIKDATDAGPNWAMFDNMRGIATGGTEQRLYANTSGAEATTGGNDIDLTATGFDIKTDLGYLNTSGSTFIYIAIRRGPMKVPTSGTSVFAPITYAGNNTANRVITGLNNAPDWVFFVSRNAEGQANHVTGSRLQGGSKYLLTESTGAEGSSTDYGVQTYGQTSVTLGAATTNEQNATGINYILYSMGRAPSFFDVVCYTGTGSARTITHNLGAVPELMIVKRRDAAANWPVYTASTATNEYLFLNSGGLPTTATTVWNNTAPTSSVFSVGTSALTNASAGTYVAYLFSSCAGVSKVGSYTGTGALQTINCGFTSGARFVLIKLISSGTSGSGDWYVWDSARGISSGNDPYLLLDSTSAEVTGTNYVDTDTTGFKVTAAGATDINASGDVYLFLAIA